MAFTRRYLIIALSFFAAVSLSAQPGPAGGEGAVRRVSLVALVNPGADYSGLFLMNGTQPTPLEVKPGSRGKKLPLAKGAKDVVLARQGVDPATGKPAYLTVAAVPWPEAKSLDAVLIIGATAASKDIKALILDDSPMAFPVETTRVVNLSGVPLLARIDRFQGEFRHGSASAPIPFPDMKKTPAGAMQRYPYAFAAQSAGGELVKLGSGFWEAAAGRRSLVIIQPPLEAGSTKIRIRIVVDYPPPPPASVTR